MKSRRTIRIRTLCLVLLCALMLQPLEAMAAVTPTIKACLTAQGISVVWSKVPNTQRYRLYRMEESERDFRVIESSVTGLSYVDKTVKSGESYTYKVRGITNNGRGYTSARSRRTALLMYLITPTITCTDQADGVKLTWTATTGASGIKYRLYRRTTGQSWMKLAEQTGRSYLDTGVTIGAKYEYMVQAVNKQGSSAKRTVSCTYSKPVVVKDKDRYIVSCNINFSNQANTLGKYNTKEKAIAAVKAQPYATRGQWFVYDCKSGMDLVYPELKTRTQKINAVTEWAAAVAADSRHGYSCVGECSDHNVRINLERWGKSGDYSCSTLVAMAYELAGGVNLRKVVAQCAISTKANGRTYQYSINSSNIAAACLKSEKFKDVTSDYKSRGVSALQTGDILINRSGGHVVMYIGDGKIVEAAMNELGREYATPKVGDQTGKEIRVKRFYGSWGTVLRLK